MNTLKSFFFSSLGHLFLLSLLLLSFTPKGGEIGNQIHIKAYLVDARIAKHVAKLQSPKASRLNTPSEHNAFARKSLHKQVRDPHNVNTSRLASNSRQGHTDPLRVLIHNLIKQQQHYPLSAAIHNIEGNVKVAFTLLPNGQIHHVITDHSSGYADLDRAALNAVRAISPIQQANHYIHQKTALALWIHFQMSQTEKT